MEKNIWIYKKKIFEKCVCIMEFYVLIKKYIMYLIVLPKENNNDGKSWQEPALGPLLIEDSNIT